MRYSKDIIGKPVYSIDDGSHLGTVRDVYIDEALAWLAGVHLGTEGLISRKSLLIAREAIVVFGVDAVLAKKADVVGEKKSMPASAQWIRLDKLQGRQVDTPGGTRVGTIGDVLLDEEAHVIGFRLSRVFVEGPIAEYPTIRREAMVDTGSEDGALTIDLARAEQHSRAALAEPEAQEAVEEVAQPVELTVPPKEVAAEEEE